MKTEAIDHCIRCCDGALTDEQRQELRSRIGGAIEAERKWYETYLFALKGELNAMALIGCKPMWGSLIGRLEQMVDDARARSA